MPSFTPGPWISDERPETQEIVVGDAAMQHEIASLRLHQRGRADSHLIAAAPDLYEALEDALTAVNAAARQEALRHGNYPRREEEDGQARIVEEWCAKARAALSRARGGDNG